MPPHVSNTHEVFPAERRRCKLKRADRAILKHAESALLGFAGTATPP